MCNTWTHGLNKTFNITNFTFVIDASVDTSGSEFYVGHLVLHHKPPVTSHSFGMCPITVFRASRVVTSETVKNGYYLPEIEVN